MGCLIIALMANFSSKPKVTAIITPSFQPYKENGSIYYYSSNSPQLPFLRYEVLPQLLVLMKILDRRPVGKLGVQGRRYQGNVPYPRDVDLLINCPKMLLGNTRCLVRDSGPSSLVKVLSRSDAPLRQRVV
jgi:hypothetical protein